MDNKSTDWVLRPDPSRTHEKTKLSRFRQSVGIEFAPLQDELILFHAPSKKFCVLNRTSSFIWAQLKDPTSCEEIADRLLGSFSEVTLDRVQNDVDSALQQMLALGLIVEVERANPSEEATR
jgi:hypothetical protein